MTHDELKYYVQRSLERRKLAYSTRLSQAVLAETRADTFIDHITDTIMIRVESAVYGERTKTGTVTERVEYPATWWDMWKRDHAPNWFVRKYPVRYKAYSVTATVTEWRMYPQAEFPLQGHGTYAVIQDVEQRGYWEE